jgi:3-deoxy-D-manno-octulosonic-acid transferase
LLHALYNASLLPVWIVLSLARPFLRNELRERIGLVDVQGSDEVRWIHCASVGELSAIAGLVRELKRREPNSRVVISTVTSTGKKRSQELFPDVYTFIAPIDFPAFVRNALDRVKPAIVLIVETELWPNLVTLANQRGVTVVTINGRLSARSLRRYLVFRGLFGRILRRIDWFFVQTDKDRSAFERLGAPKDRISVTGTMKSDLSVGSADRKGLSNLFAIPAKAWVVVAGSVRPEEEEDVLRALVAVSEVLPSAYSVVAPRHLRRAHSIAKHAKDMGVKVRFRSDGCGYMGEKVLILDTLGELTRLYSIAHVSFVGGSLRPYGGHNVLEPAAWGVPVLFGEYTDNCCRDADELVALNGGVRVEGWEDLAANILLLLKDEKLRQDMGSNARKVVQRRSGVSARVYEALRAKGYVQE